MRTDRIGGDPESSAQKSRSGEFHRRHLIARSSKRRHQLVQMRPVAGFAFYIGDDAIGRQAGKHPLVIKLDDVDLLLSENSSEERRGGQACDITWYYQRSRDN